MHDGGARHAVHVRFVGVIRAQSETADVVRNGQLRAEVVANSWSVRGRTHHVDVQNYFLRAKQPGAVDDNTHTYKTGNFAM